jgi:WD40 repeat protein
VLGCHNRMVYILHLEKRNEAEPIGPQVKSGVIGRVIKSAVQRVQCLAVSPDGRYALSGSETTAQLWDLKEAKEIRRFDHKSYIFCLAFSPKGDRMLTGGEAGELLVKGKKVLGCAVRLWNVDSGKELKQFLHEARILSCAFSADGQRALTGSGLIESSPVRRAVDCRMRLWDLKTGEELKQFSDHKMPVWQVKFAPDGRHGFSLSDRLYSWDLDKPQPKLEIAGVGDLTFTSDGDVVIGRDPNGLRVDYRKARTRLILPLRPPVVINCAAVSDDNRYLLVGFGRPLVEGRKFVKKKGQIVYTDCAVRLFDLTARKELKLLEGHEQMVTSVAFSPDNRFAVSGDAGGNIRKWDLTKYTATAK